ncbi:MAG: hypothetical protein AAB415_00400 [Patescibacteria group bacterium]
MSKSTPKTGIKEIRSILITVFSAKQVDSLLKYFLDGAKKYRSGDWEGVGIKAGKFVEAVVKCLMIYCGQSVPAARKFKAGVALKNLETLNSSYSEVVRIVIPKSCLFLYEIASNRGGRHDADDVDANEMDAKAVIPLMSWVVAEIVRFSNAETTTPADISALIESLSEKIYPSFEEIDGRPYINFDRLSAPEIGLLLLYFKYPHRIERQVLVDAIKRHGPKKNAAEVAAHRLKSLVDDDNGVWKLRGLGRQKAETFLNGRV